MQITECIKARWRARRAKESHVAARANTRGTTANDASSRQHEKGLGWKSILLRLVLNTSTPVRTDIRRLIERGSRERW